LVPSVFRRLFMACCIALICGCSNLLFYPLKPHVIDPRDKGVEYQDLYIATADNQQLHGWLFPQSGDLKGTVLFFHGNGENISTHAGAVYWLPQYGYRVILVDYRGYGKSQGVATLDGAIQDVEFSIRYTLAQFKDNKPLIILAQSLGASMSIYAVAEEPDKKDIDALVLIAPFSDYHKIARETLSKGWLTWLFQIPLSWTISNEYNPSRFIASVNPIPVYFIYGSRDQLISPEHSKRLYELAKKPKQLISLEAGHNDLASRAKYREILLKILQEVTSRTMAE